MRLLRPVFLLALGFVGVPAWAAAPQLQASVLRARPSSTPGLHRFAVIGDGGTGDPVQLSVASRLMQTHVRNPIASLVLAGDNVYVQGESEHFENALDKPYRQFVEAGVRILPVLGNHDVPLDRGRAQLAYLGLGAKRWYKTTLAAGDVELFAIDTTLHVTDEFSYLTPAANAWRIRHAEKQKSWLAESLAASTARYKVIVGHHPLYSSGSRAGERYQLRGEIGDIIDHGNVAAYVAGHQHIYERREPIHGVVHFVTGGGGRDPALLGGRGRLPNVHFLENHFTLFTASPAGLEYQAIAIDGSTIDSGIIAPR